MNSFGRCYRISIFGESHGQCVGVCIDGCPSGIPIKNEDFLIDLKRRSAGSFGTTTRKETDLPQIISGVYNGFSTGMPITILFDNKDINSDDYSQSLPRPSHSDFVAYQKYGSFNDYRGGGAFSGRMTIAIVVAGTIAKKIISPIKTASNVLVINGNTELKEEIALANNKQDSIGGIVECKIQNISIGLGEPFFDTFESMLSHLIFSIPGIKGIEFGDGFSLAQRYGSEVNDEIIDISGKTKTNHSGGINAGISNSNDIIFRVAARPTPSIPKPQQTIDLMTGEKSQINIKGRYDICFALRLPPILEAVAAIVTADFLLLYNSNKTCRL